MGDYALVIGSINYDIILCQKRLPRAGETYVVDGVRCAGGGKGANQAVQCAKLGLPVRMAGLIGPDPMGEQILQDMNAFGVDTSLVQRCAVQTGMGIIHTLEDGTVYASISSGANAMADTAYLSAISEYIRDAQIVLLQMEIPQETNERIIEAAFAAGVPIILNAAPAASISKEALGKVDYFIVNETEASYYSGVKVSDLETAKSAAPILLEMIRGSLIITLGANGSLLGDQSGDQHWIQPQKIKDVVDTTGAGDSYIGAFAYCKINHMDDLDACVFASRAAGLTVGGMGAQASMPRLINGKISV